MNFSKALHLIKEGKLLTRTGWNGNNLQPPAEKPRLYVFLVEGSVFNVSREPLNAIFQAGTEITYRPHIDMRYVDGTVGVWGPVMDDILADDWEVVE